ASNSASSIATSIVPRRASRSRADRRESAALPRERARRLSPETERASWSEDRVLAKAEVAAVLLVQLALERARAAHRRLVRFGAPRQRVSSCGRRMRAGQKRQRNDHDEHDSHGGASVERRRPTRQRISKQEGARRWWGLPSASKARRASSFLRPDSRPGRLRRLSRRRPFPNRELNAATPRRAPATKSVPEARRPPRWPALPPRLPPRRAESRPRCRGACTPPAPCPPG